jgi:hydroxycarboxylate dehydrogenase B
MPVVDVQNLQSIVGNIFERLGVPPLAAAQVAQHLVEANLFGHDSHGLLRVAQYCQAIENGEVDPTGCPKVIRESMSGAVVDGARAFGQVAARFAMDIAINKAARGGIAAVTVFNCYHSGRLGAYSAMAADAGMIGIVMVNAGGGGQSVVPFGGSQRRLATNPFSIAAPTSGEFPLVLDVATSMAPEGKIRDYALRGAKLPEGWIVDSNGHPTCDPQDFYQQPPGALLPLGGPVGHKGFGLALMIDILAGALSGAGCCRQENVPARDGVLLIALDVEQFTDRVRFYEQVRELVAYIKACPPAPGFEEVLVPGETEFREAQQRRRSGITIDENIWQKFSALANQLGATNLSDAFSNGLALHMHAPARSATHNADTMHRR